MPKVGIDTSESSKSAPRKRAVRRVVTSSATKTRKPRTTRSETPRVSSSSTPVRKAPTVISKTRTENRGSFKKYLILSVFCVLVFGVAAWIGNSDAGVIDVTAKINEKQQGSTGDTGVASGSDGSSPTGEVVIPVQNVPAAALNLTGRGAEPTPEPTPEPVAEATTTESSSTSTDEVVTDNVESTPDSEAVTSQ